MCDGNVYTYISNNATMNFHAFANFNMCYLIKYQIAGRITN